MRRGSKDGKAVEVTAARERRRKSREIDRQLHPWTARRLTAWALFVLAFVIAVQHILAHLGARPIPLSMGLQDIVIGWPMALALGVVGLMIIDPPTPTKDSKKSAKRPRK